VLKNPAKAVPKESEKKTLTDISRGKNSCKSETNEGDPRRPKVYIPGVQWHLIKISFFCSKQQMGRGKEILNMRGKKRLHTEGSSDP